MYRKMQMKNEQERGEKEVLHCIIVTARSKKVKPMKILPFQLCKFTKRFNILHLQTIDLIMLFTSLI